MNCLRRTDVRGYKIDHVMAGLAIAAILLLTSWSLPAQAQTLTPLHQFLGITDGRTDGATPQVGLTADRAGNLYGTTTAGGKLGTHCNAEGCGSVFKVEHAGTGWVYVPLYDFPGGENGFVPQGRVIVAPDGSLYGTATAGGQGTCDTDDNLGCGVVFHLQPPASICRSFSCPWTETVLYAFTGGADGAYPNGDLVLDGAGNLYGIAGGGHFDNNICYSGCGVVYKLTKVNGSWSETVLYTFQGSTDGAYPSGGVVFDTSGNLYGATTGGGNLNCATGEGTGCGTLYELSPSQSGWALNTLYTFEGGNDGYWPRGGLAFGGASTIYGTTVYGGNAGGGTIFQLTNIGGNLTFSTIYSLSGSRGSTGGPWGTLAVTPSGTLYGASLANGTIGIGYIFQLTPSNGSWIFTDLHDFVGREGSYPFDGLVVDAGGNIYGTASSDGELDDGTLFEITP